MDKLSSLSYKDGGGCLTPKMLEEGMKALWDSHERAEERRWNYYAAVRPLLDKLDPNDLEGIYAVVVLTQSGFYEPIHPETAKWCLKIVRDRGIKDFD